MLSAQWHRNEFESGECTDPKRKWGIDQAPEKKFSVVPLHFLALKAQLVVLASAFVMVSTVWSVSCLLFFYSRCHPCPPICKSGGTCPRVPWSRRHCECCSETQLIDVAIIVTAVADCKDQLMNDKRFCAYRVREG